MNSLGCLWRGFHTVIGHGYGTSADSVVWAGHCRDCGIRVERITKDRS